MEREAGRDDGLRDRPAVGGTWRYVMVADGGFEVGFHGEYREIVPKSGSSPPRSTRACPRGRRGDGQHATFTEEDGRTTLTTLVQHSTKERRDGHINSGMEAGMQDAHGPAGTGRRLPALSRAAEDSNRRMLRARDAMDRDYAQPLDIQTLAKIAIVSEAHFIRVFKATFGETPHRYLQRRRVERAMFLLRETDRSVTEICLDVGFNSLGTFTRTFTRDRGRSADHLPLARGRSQGGPGLLLEGVDETEQFWRSQARERGLGSST